MNAKACRLTGALPAAVAIVRLEGPDAGKVLQSLGASKLPGSGELRRARLCSPRGDELDDALLCGRGGGVYEVGLHGGAAVVRGFLDAVEARGVLVESSGPLRGPALEAAAMEAANELVSPCAALGLHAQARGVLREELLAIGACVDSGELHRARDLARQLERRSAAAAPYWRPLRLAVLGPPSAGKSSFFNAVVGYQQNLVDAKPGSTLDAVVQRVRLGQLTVDLWDTAGLDPCALGVQAEAVRAALGQARTADLRLWLSVCGRDPAPPDLWREGDLELATCADLGPPERAGLWSVAVLEHPDAVREELVARLSGLWPQPMDLAEAISRLFRERDIHSLRAALEESEPQALIRFVRELVNGSAFLEDRASA